MKLLEKIRGVFGKNETAAEDITEQYIRLCEDRTLENLNAVMMEENRKKMEKACEMIRELA